MLFIGGGKEMHAPQTESGSGFLLSFRAVIPYDTAHQLMDALKTSPSEQGVSPELSKLLKFSKP